MDKRSTGKKKLKTFRENYYTEEILSDKIFRKGEKVFFILFPYNQSDNFKVFSGETMFSRQNKDLTYEYAIKIHTGYDKREVLKDFFHNNWFKSVQGNDPKDLSEYTKKFSFTDYELVEDSDQNLTYGKYSTFFRNHSEKFIFLVNEAFIFDRLHIAHEYCVKMSLITVCNKIKDLHDIMVSDSLRISKSKLYEYSSAGFFKTVRPLIIKVIEELGPEYNHFLEGDKMKGFLNDYILNRRYRRMEFTKNRKALIQKSSHNTRKREKDI